MGLAIEFTVPGKPTGKGRPRFARRGKFVQTYTPAQTQNYEDLVRWHFKQAAIANGIEMLDGALQMHIYAAHKMPTSTPKKRIAEVDESPAKVKPDADNVAKIIADALNGVAWTDDNQVTYLSVIKRYTDKEPYVRVTISQDTKEQK